MGKSSKKRERVPDEDDVAIKSDTAVLKKTKVDESGKSCVTKEAAVEGSAKSKIDKSEQKEKKDKSEKKEKKSKKEKKEKSSKTLKKVPSLIPASAYGYEVVKDEKKGADVESAATPGVDEASSPKKSKKDKKEKREKKEKKEKKVKKSKSEKDEDDSEDKMDVDGDANEKQEEEGEEPTTGKNARFICFIGNLPFSATADHIKAHFANVHPTSVRLLTEKENSKKSRGIAFIEFARYDHMKTCLEKYHHSEFNDGISEPRKINVELTLVFPSAPPSWIPHAWSTLFAEQPLISPSPTSRASSPSCSRLSPPLTDTLILGQSSAGGGGASANRTEKIKEKNKKLNEERANRMKKEEAAKLEKQANKTDGQVAGEDTPAPTKNDDDGIHPSRRGLVPFTEGYDENAQDDYDQGFGGGGGGRRGGGRFGGGRGRGRGGGGGFRGRGGGRGGGGGRGRGKW